MIIPDFKTAVTWAAEQDSQFGELSRTDCLAVAKAYLDEQRAEIMTRHREGASGANVVDLLSSLADELVNGVFLFALRQVPKPKSILKRVAICAHGGYGRRQLNPHSDLDIGLVYEGRIDKNLKSLNDYMVPFLWDLGYEISFVAHSIKEAKELARIDTKVFTSYLSCRYLAGREEVYGKLRLALDGLKPREISHRYAELRLRERGDSLAEEHRDLYAPEPNIKDGAGGLRDYQTGLWLMAVSHGAGTLDEIASHGFITKEERLAIAEALDFIWRIRNELHYLCAKAEDTLTFALEQDVAIALGYTDKTKRDTSRFMQDYYTAARVLQHFLRVAAHSCDDDIAESIVKPEAPENTEFSVENGELNAGLHDVQWYTENPARLMSVFWECARRDVPIGLDSERRITENLHLIGDDFRSSDLVRRFFLALCSRPLQAGRALRQAAQSGVLERYLPEFGDVRDIIRYEDFHHYPVDEHTLRAVEALALIPELEGSVGNFLKDTLEHLMDPHILVLALLFHDLGKVSGEDHSDEGMRLAKTIGARIGLPHEDTERIAFLVQHHLLMTHIALYRDTDDADVIESFAKTMKSEHRLRALFLLSYADMSAVAPNVWNDWKGTLLLKLYLKTEKVLLGYSEDTDEEFWKQPKAIAVQAFLDDELKGQLDTHLKAFGGQYLSAFPAEQIAFHIQCLNQADEHGFAALCVPNEDQETSEMIVCTPDHPGLFEEITGCFASQLVDVERADLYTRPDGMALDSFTVVNPSRRTPLSDAQVKVVESALKDVLTGVRQVDELLEQSQRRIFTGRFS
ncbi:MAG: [protein-PII] uridylyltransferase [Candidatus Hydrogenedentota bacterium]|nr:MAG: [protein-PII] uridylyltransferase [Candidatus Hydrogenedentota bacterium]